MCFQHAASVLDYCQFAVEQDPVHAEIHTEAIEGLWMQAMRNLHFQSNRELLPLNCQLFNGETVTSCMFL